MLLENKIVVVTGGGGGIGGAVAAALAKEGAKVCIVDYSQQDLDHSTARLTDTGYQVIGFKADVLHKEDVKNIFRTISKKWGDVQVLVNAAGIQGPIGLLTDNPVDDWIRTIQVNLIGTYLCMREALFSMVKNKYGKIINFSGGGATSPRVRFSAYATSKTAVVRMTEIAAEEYKPLGICINAIAPGATKTNMIREILKAGEESVGKEYQDALNIEQNGGTDPGLAAGLICFLASDLSNGITGRLLSAVWDPWREETYKTELLNNTHLATLRRIDNRDFFFKS